MRGMSWSGRRHPRRFVRRPGRLRDQDLVYIDALMARLSRDGDACVLRYQGRDTRALDFLGMIARYARVLDELGIGRGNLVALFAPNRRRRSRSATRPTCSAPPRSFSPPRPADGRAALRRRLEPDLLVLFPETAPLLPAGLTIRVPGRWMRRPGPVEATAPRRARRRPVERSPAGPGATRGPRGDRLVRAAPPASRRQLAHLRDLHRHAARARAPSAASSPTAASPTSPRSSSTRPCSAAARWSSPTASSPTRSWRRSRPSGSPTCSSSSPSSSRLMDHPDVAPAATCRRCAR